MRFRKPLRAAVPADWGLMVRGWATFSRRRLGQVASKRRARVCLSKTAGQRAQGEMRSVAGRAKAWCLVSRHVRCNIGLGADKSGALLHRALGGDSWVACSDQYHCGLVVSGPWQGPWLA
ncbi:hypothetical protein IF2G_03437 [Cordyceps javanica]|nr:hypothetical protein IF2G_03437 [Cordyceps javanica]